MYSIILNDNQLETISGMTTEFPLYVESVDLTQLNVPWHWHEAVEFKYVVRGTMKLTTERAEYTIGAGEATYTNTNVLETAEPAGSGGTEVITLLFDPVLLSGHFQSVFEKKYVRPVLTNRQIDVLKISPDSVRGSKICRKIQEIYRLYPQKNMEFQIRNILSELWLLLLEAIDEELHSRPAASIPTRDRIRYMLRYIHLNYPDKLTMEAIAESASISEREALRTFKRVLGKSPTDYLTEYRLTKARELLETTDQSITEIAFGTGFSDGAYFGKVFRKYFGCTPGAYRRSRVKQTD